MQASLRALKAEKTKVDTENLRGSLVTMAGDLRGASRRLGSDRRSSVQAIGGGLSHMAGLVDQAVVSYDKSAGKTPSPFLRGALARVQKVAGEVLLHVKGDVREPARVAEVVNLASSILSA